MLILGPLDKVGMLPHSRFETCKSMVHEVVRLVDLLRGFRSHSVTSI